MGYAEEYRYVTYFVPETSGGEQVRKSRWRDDGISHVWHGIACMYMRKRSERWGCK